MPHLRRSAALLPGGRRDYMDLVARRRTRLVRRDCSTGRENVECGGWRQPAGRLVCAGAHPCIGPSLWNAERLRSTP